MLLRSSCVLGLMVAVVPGCSSDGRPSAASEPDAATTEHPASGGAPSTAGAGGQGTGSGGRSTSGAGAGGVSSGSGGVPGGAGRPSGMGGASSGGAPEPPDGGGDAGTSPVHAGPFFSPYKDTSINMNWNTNVVSTNVSGSQAPFATELTKNGASTVTLAFATGECGSETWAGLAGDTMASTNAPLLSKANIRYIVSTGGAAGVFTCSTDPGFATFVERWMSAGLVGIDFDIEAGQTDAQIQDLVRRIKVGHSAYPALRYSLTLATLANNEGATTARSLGNAAQDSFNTYGDRAMAAVKSTLGFSGNPATWPGYLTLNLMTMDYGAPGSGVCVVSAGVCQMAQSAIQAAYDLHDKWGVPYASVELTPMIGVNDVSSEKVALPDVDAIAAFALAQGLAGVHYWSYDRDTDCAAGAAAPTCNSMGAGYAGPSGYLSRFLAAGLR